jgi:hypothetical protein
VGVGWECTFSFLIVTLSSKQLEKERGVPVERLCKSRICCSKLLSQGLNHRRVLLHNFPELIKHRALAQRVKVDLWSSLSGRRSSLLLLLLLLGELGERLGRCRTKHTGGALDIHETSFAEHLIEVRGRPVGRGVRQQGQAPGPQHLWGQLLGLGLEPRVRVPRPPNGQGCPEDNLN